jgi:hypothetical protein
LPSGTTSLFPQERGFSKADWLLPWPVGDFAGRGLAAGVEFRTFKYHSQAIANTAASNIKSMGSVSLSVVAAELAAREGHRWHFGIIPDASKPQQLICEFHIYHK